MVLEILLFETTILPVRAVLPAFSVTEKDNVAEPLTESEETISQGAFETAAHLKSVVTLVVNPSASESILKADCDRLIDPLAWVTVIFMSGTVSPFKVRVAIRGSIVGFVSLIVNVIVALPAAVEGETVSQAALSVAFQITFEEILRVAVVPDKSPNPMGDDEAENITDGVLKDFISP